MKNLIMPLAKSVIISLGLTAAASAAGAGIYQKILGSGRSSAPKTLTLIISNDKMRDLIETVKSLKDSDLWLKEVSKAIQNEAKKQKVGFCSMLIGTLGASLLGNILAGKGINRAGEGVIAKSLPKKTKSKGQDWEIVRASCGNKKVWKATTKYKTDF